MNCLFCQIIEGTLPSTPCYQDEKVFAFPDLHPRAPTHVLIVPKKHIATINELMPEDAELVGHMVLTAKHLAQEYGLAEQGFRLVTNCNSWGGQTVFHVHLHLLGGRAMEWPPG
jgi:histidine triad (HIT) family protein